VVGSYRVVFPRNDGYSLELKASDLLLVCPNPKSQPLLPRESSLPMVGVGTSFSLLLIQC
jgi:hypothetical protein